MCPKVGHITSVHAHAKLKEIHEIHEQSDLLAEVFSQPLFDPCNIIKIISYII